MWIDAALLSQWAAPHGILGAWSDPPRLRRERLVAVTEGDAPGTPPWAAFVRAGHDVGYLFGETPLLTTPGYDPSQ